MPKLSFVRSAISLLVAAAAALVTAFATDGTPPASAEEPASLLANASFEDAGTGGVPAHWETFEGATQGGAPQPSEVAIDRETVKHGKASLRLSGGAGTTSWQFVRQRIPVLPGQRISYRVAAKSAGVRKEGAQYPNAHGLIEFTDAAGARVQMLWTQPLAGDRDWCELRLTAIVPEKSESAWIGCFLSQSGTMWFDDVRVTVSPASLTDLAGRTAAFDAIETHLRSTYPFFGLGRKPTADLLFTKNRDRCLAAKDEDGFIAALKSTLGELDDLHIWMKRGGKPIASATAKHMPPSFDAAARRAALTSVADETKPFLAGRIGEGAAAIGYLEIGSWQLDEAAVVRLEKLLDGLADCRALVLDVRQNMGGDETIAQRIASRFAKADLVYARTFYRDPLSEATDAFLPGADRVLAARKGVTPDPRAVAVLQGPICMSSCEGFLLMCRALPTVTTVGMTSRGATANPRPIAITSDFILNSSTWRTSPPGGEAKDTIEGRGVEPETAVSWPPGTKGADPILAKAIELLSK